MALDATFREHHVYHMILSAIFRRAHVRLNVRPIGLSGLPVGASFRGS